MSESPEQHLLGVLAEDDEPLGYADVVFEERQRARKVVLGYLRQGRIVAMRHSKAVSSHDWHTMLDDPTAWDRDSPDRVILCAPPGRDPLEE